MGDAGAINAAPPTLCTAVGYCCWGGGGGGLTPDDEVALLLMLLFCCRIGVPAREVGVRRTAGSAGGAPAVGAPAADELSRRGVPTGDAGRDVGTLTLGGLLKLAAESGATAAVVVSGYGGCC